LFVRAWTLAIQDFSLQPFLSRGGRGMFPGIGRADDDADGFLVETLVAAVALQGFQMAAQGAFL